MLAAYVTKRNFKHSNEFIYDHGGYLSMKTPAQRTTITSVGRALRRERLFPLALGGLGLEGSDALVLVNHELGLLLQHHGGHEYTISFHPYIPLHPRNCI